MLSVYKKIHQFYIKDINPEDRLVWFRKSHKDKIFYVYIKIRPNGKPFWVGKGYGMRAFSKNGRNYVYKHTLNKYSENNIKTSIVIIGNEDEAYLEEIRLIAYFRALGCKLANRTDGGLGSTGLIFAADHRANLSKAAKGRQKTKLHKENISKARKGQEPWNKGKTGLQTSWCKGKPLALSHCENIRKGRLGILHTQEAKDKISESGKGREPWNKGKKLGPLSQDQRDKMSKTLTGRGYSKEQRANISKGRLAGIKSRKEKSRNAP